MFECWGEISHQLSSSAGKVHSAVSSLEKADPKVLFKSTDGVADAGLGHAQLNRSRLEAEQACRSFEHEQRLR